MLRPILATVLLATSLSACASMSVSPAPPAQMAALSRARSAAFTDRMVIRSADALIEVADLDVARSAAERAAKEAGGHLESARETADESISLEFRIPEPALDAFLEHLRGLGDPEHFSVASHDVTEEHADLATRQANDIALRARLRQLLDRAEGVEEVLAVEKELARLQGEIEARQARLDRIESQVSFSSVAVTFKRERVLGPLGWVSYGTWWVISKLFVID